MTPIAAFYHAGKARNGAGDVINGKNGVAVSADSWMVQPVLVYAPKYALLGADWGMILVPTYGEAGAAARMTHDKGGQTLFDNKGKGLADLYAVPVNLTWHISSYLDLSAQYAFWAPIGKYDSTSTENVGLGYWSHDFRGTVSYFPLGNPGLLLSASVMEELNSEKQGFDLRPAPHTSCELGASMAFSARFMCGLLAYGIWETGDATGSDAKEDGHDRMFGVGAEASYWFVPGKYGAIIRVTKEFQVRDRFEGATLITGLNFLF